MKVYRPSDLQAFLREKGVHAKKGLSQNFLIDGNIIQKILDTASMTEKDFVIEIGSGPGALTQALLSRGAHVTAIEMDSAFAAALNRLQTLDHRLQVICEDILKFPLVDFLQKHPGKKFKVVANLPYHITTPILVMLLPLHPWIESLTIMVQKEFGDRLYGKVGTPEYSSLTLFLQFYATISKSFTVSPNCFYPKPNVHSAVLHCQLHPPLLDNNVETFFQLTRTAFGQRRKMLRASLKELYGSEKIERALVKIGHPITQRPEQLTIHEFILLYEALDLRE